MPANKPTLAPSDFVHLHNHTQYSLLDGLTKVPALLEHVAASGMEAVAITDHGTLSGAIEFYEQALQHEVKPIIGIEAYVAARGHTDKDPSKDKLNYHLILLAMNEEGYQNLLRLSTIANLDGMYYRPRIDHKLLEKYNDGLIVLSGCIGGEVGDSLRQGQYAKAKEAASWYKDVFGDRYYIEVQDHGHPKHPSVWDEQAEVNKQALKLAKELDLPCVVTCDAHYLKREDQEAHEILLCVQTGSFLSDEQRMSLKNFELHVTDPKEVIERWGSEHPELILNSRAIADRCNVNIDLGKILIPKFPLPKNETEKSHLHSLVYQGLAWRYGQVAEPKTANLSIAAAKKNLPKEIVERAVYELGVIDQMNFNGYFLIIADFIRWGKAQGIVFGPGRGSAAGSIIAYALKITELDPIEYDLLFERFLNPDRISMPDIDIDIQDSRRDEVIRYCIDKYGSDRVANIVTFGRMAARNAVRDVARVLEVPYAEADHLAKMIPPPIQGRHIPLEKSIKENYELKHEYETSETAKRVFDLAVQLEGTIRSHGVHAAGVVIAPDDIVHYTPLELAQKGVVATQYSMGPIEELGLLKIDFLGLSNLTIIKNALRIIKRVYKKDIDINTIPLDDVKTFELLSRGDTTGVFQLESAGMKRYLKQLKPTNFEDIISMVALYRPGPMQFIDQFIARKTGQEAITYLHPAMEPALKNTYGVIVTQEQVMQISKEMCGFSGGQADTLRKAIGKKNPQILAKMEDEFIEGAIKTVGADRTLMAKLWRQIEDFAAYCFNKAHSACYAMIAYQTAYLKAHYPAAMMAALMTSDFDNTDRLTIEITECQHMGIAVLPPDVNESFVEFAVVPGEKLGIRFGMAAIKNVGTAAVEEILRAREDAGHFKDLEDFLGRVNARVVNRKTLESLIKAGAFDRYGDRSTLLHNLDGLVAYSGRLQKQALSGQTDLFGNALTGVAVKAKLAFEKPETVYSPTEQLQWERELLGLYLSQHPLKAYEQFLSEQTVPLNELVSEHDGKTVSVGGAVMDVREITTKNGQKMAFVKLEDHYGEIELVLFPGNYQQNAQLWQRDRVVLARGKISNRDRSGNAGSEVKVMVDGANEITAEQLEAYKPTGKKKRTPKPKDHIEPQLTLARPVQAPAAIAESPSERVYIRLPNGEDQQTLLKLKATIDDFRGNTEVVLVLGSDDNKQAIKLPSKIDNQKSALSRLMETVGAANVIVR
jgi:DNA polymerase-3 subunit alpha